MYVSLVIWIVSLLFPTKNAATNEFKSSGLCPIGYWPARVNTSSGAYGTERTFDLPFVEGMKEPICYFCPHVGCYVVKYKIEEEKNKKKKRKKPITSRLPTQTATTIATITAIHKWVSENDTEIYWHNDNNSSSSFNTTDSPEEYEGEDQPDIEYNYYASCSFWQNLPPPKDIVSYLDCVMIGGQKDQYYLFIYEPRFQATRVPVVDCVDTNFLDWIPEGTQLLGLELGFRMRAIPPYLFRYKQRLMQLTQYMCIDGSSLTNKSIPFDDTERFASNKLKQVIFRTTSLQRDRKPPQAQDARYNMSFQSDEVVESCPLIVQHKPANITKDCQFLPTSLPTTSDKVDEEKARERCPFSNKRKKLGSKIHRTDRKGSVTYPKNIAFLLEACLSVVVLVITVGTIVAFCVMNAEKLMLCRTRARKRREREADLAMQLAEQAAKEQAAALEAEERRQNAWHPIYGRYGVVPTAMGGAFGAFASRTLDVPVNPPNPVGGSS